jgi:DNA-binding MarR family transcriptional regulator
MKPDQLIYLVAKLHRQLQNRLDQRLQSLDLSVEQWRVIYALDRRQGQSMGDLANEVLMNHPALTKMIDRMVAVGLVHRAPDANDQRRVLVYLTDRGTSIRGRVIKLVQDNEYRLRNALGDNRYQAIVSLLAEAENATTD